MRIGEGYGDEPSLEGSKCTAVDACESPQEVPAASLGETSYLTSDTSRTIYVGMYLITCSVLLDGETRDRAAYGI